MTYLILVVTTLLFLSYTVLQRNLLMMRFLANPCNDIHDSSLNLDQPKGIKNDSNDATLAFTVENLGCKDIQSFALCGFTKCFYHLSSTEGMGYTVGRLTDKIEQAARRNWKFSIYLENEYGIPRLALDQPQVLTNITTEMSECLQTKRRSIGGHPRDDQMPDFSLPKRRKRRKEIQYIAQLNRAVKYPNILFKCKPSLKEAITESETEVYWNGISNYDTYLRNLRRETALAKHVLYKEPYLLPDFQVLVDQEANFHYIDVGHFVAAGKLSGNCTGAFDILESVAKQQAAIRGIEILSSESRD